MKFEEGIHESAPAELQVTPDPAPLSPRQRRKQARWAQFLAAVLLIVCLTAVVFLSLHGQQSSQNSPAPASVASYNWCATSGAQIAAPAGKLTLSNVVAIASNDVWALGTTVQGSLNLNTASNAPVLEHWNGTNWSVVPAADTGALLGTLTSQVQGASNQLEPLESLSAVSSNDVWAVGGVSISQFSSTSGQITLGHTLVEHWDGSQWKLVKSPDGTAQGDNNLYSVAAISANDVWAVGSQQPASTPGSAPQFLPLTEHWDGTSWHIVQLPTALQHGYLNIVKAISSNDVWAFGATTTPPIVSLAAHWDGKNWNVAALPANLVAGDFFSVVAVASNNIWAVGSGVNNLGQLSSEPVIAHWDGQAWTSVPGAAGLNAGSRLTGLAATGADDVWAVGNTGDNKPLIEHWDGSTWSLRSPTNPAFGTLSGIAVVGDKSWAVGLSYADTTGAGIIGAVIENNC